MSNSNQLTIANVMAGQRVKLRNALNKGVDAFGTVLFYSGAVDKVFVELDGQGMVSHPAGYFELV